MAIDIPTGALGRGGIQWFTQDPVAAAKVARGERQAKALGMLGAGIKRGVTNYMKGGLRGVIDPQYAEEQDQAAKEDAELSARLGDQTDKAVEENKQPNEKGTPSAEPVVKPTEPQTPLGQVAQFGGGLLKKIYEGPGKRVDLTELARKRGMVERQEDLTKRLQAVSPAFRNVEDPGEAISRFLEQGPAGLRGLKPKAPKEPETLMNDPIYRREKAQADAEGRPVDWDKIQRERQAETTRRATEQKELEHKYEVPGKDEDEWNKATESLHQEGNQNPTDMDIAKRRRKMFGPFPGQRGASSGSGVRGQAAQQKHDAAQAYLRRGLDRDPTEEEISQLVQGWAKTGDVDKLQDYGFLPRDFDSSRLMPPKKEPGKAGGAAVGGILGGPSQHHTAQGGISEQQPDKTPKQADQRVGEQDRTPAKPTEHRRTYNKPPGADRKPTVPDVPIYQ